MGEIWYGGTIYTMNKEFETVEAVLVQDGRIVDIGKKEELCSSYTIESYHHLQGNVMFPGFVDSHMHLIGHGERLLTLDLTKCTSYEELLSQVKEKVDATSEGEWIIGEGWNENLFQDRQAVHAEDLDAISNRHPILLKRVCRHAMLVNSFVLQKAGITEGTEDPKGGKIGRGDRGELTGVLYDKAQQSVQQLIPQQTEQYIQKALRLAIKDCYEKGLVGGHTEDLHYYGGFAKTYAAFQSVINETSFKAHLLVHHAEMEQLQNYTNERYIEFGAIKIFADGSLGGRTALLSEPYNDMPNTKGVAIFDRDELAKLVEEARHLQCPVAIHAIGDLAFEYVLDAIEMHPPLNGQRDRIIHCQVLRQDLINRAKHLSIVLDIQPTFVASDFPSVEQKLGKERLQYAYAWKTLLGEGLHCAGGSDAPIEDSSPILGIYAAITRISSFDGISYQPREKLSPFEAVSLYTVGSAYAIKKEQSRGKILPGFEADFTIVNQDLMKINDNDLLETKVVMTVIDGTIVYSG